MTPRKTKALRPADPSPGRFCMLPKIHKENNPGRPIISGISTLTEPISTYIDSLIKHIPPTHPSYRRDTSHFLEEVAKVNVPDGALLLTLDVASLYTNIQHDDGIQALVTSYAKHKNLDSPSPRAIKTLTKLILSASSSDPYATGRVCPPVFF